MKKRKLNGKLIAGICATLLIVLSLVKVPRFISNQKLQKLGYSEEAIAKIYEQKLNKTIINNSYFSAQLEEVILNDTYQEKYLQLYLNTERMTEDDFYLYERIKEIKEYSDDELLAIFTNLKDYEIIPLLVFDKQENINDYIEDCHNNIGNSKTSLSLNKGEGYLNAYENVNEVAEKDNIQALINMKNYLGEYVPSDLENTVSLYSIPNVSLRKEAMEAFVNMCDAMRKDKLYIYAIGGYRSYEAQETAYDSYLSKKLADAMMTRPGYQELQTGLSVKVYSESVKEKGSFDNTDEYKWLQQHATDYGFIFRYQKGKEIITGYEAQKDYLRYVGKELAKKVLDSGLSYDEYYMLYLY